MDASRSRYGRWPNPVRDSNGQHDNAVRLSFRAAERGPCDPGDPLMQAPVPRAVDFTEPAILDGAGGGNRTHTPLGTGF